MVGGLRGYTPSTRPFSRRRDLCQTAPMTRALISNRLARRLFLHHHLLLRPGGDLEDVLHDLGFVQVDSVNTLARAHDMILWSRRPRYRPPHLDALIARRRAAFEHWTHDAAVIPMRFYPMWRLKFARDEAHMQRRWPKWRNEGWDREFDSVLRHIADHGPASVADVGPEEPRGSGGWWDWHPSKTALEYLWRSGRLAICHREGFRKVYDLAERVIPAQHFAARMEAEAVLDWAMEAALARLGFATSGELAAFFAIATPQEAKAWCAAALASGRIAEVDVELADGSRRTSFAAPGLAETAAALPEPSPRIRLLSPFDPLLRDRARAERLFGFRYRIEIFVPAARRQYGYYVFPVLQGDRLIGRLDARRDGATLAVRAFWPEAGVRMGKARVAGLAAELERIAPLAGVEAIAFAPDWLRG